MRSHPTTVRAKEHLDRLREKPRHVRENITLLVSGGLTLIVFVGWFGALASSDKFALSPTTKESAPIENPAQKAKESWNSLLGAAGAAQTGGSTSPASITIVDEERKDEEYSQNATDQKVIHF